jgi:predicted Zn-dependent peptidase
MGQMYPVHPVSVPILGTEDTIAQITPQTLYDCHRAFYTPSNMVLCVVGDVEPETVEAIALEMTGNIPVPNVTRCRSWAEEMVCREPYREEKMEVSMPTFQLGFKCEPLPDGAEGVRREMVADLAAEALFGESSALYLEMYEEGIIDTSFGGGFETIDGMAMLMASGDSEDPRAVREAILQRAQQIAREGVEAEDFLRMKRSAMGRRLRGLDSFDSTCFRLCACCLTDYDYLDFPQIYETIGPEDIREFIERVVTNERCALSVVRPLD